MRLRILGILLIISINTFGTHNRAGEIVYDYLGGYTYRFKIVTYTYRYSPADRDSLFMQIGDEAIITAPRDTQIIITNTTYFWNIYYATYTFAGPGTYEIVVEDPNRNRGVKNIPNSVYIPFSIRTIMLVNPDIGPNNAPELLSPPIHKAALDRIFIHNPITFDLEGDSLSYRFTPCTGANGQPIQRYTLPEASNYFTIDSASGKMEWNSPVETGIFNVAIAVDEWRNGIKIGSITRDMQIEVFENDNYPPEIDKINDYCVLVDDTIEFEFEIHDYENNNISCVADGGPFRFGNSKPEFEQISSTAGLARYKFRWIPGCEYVRSKPYYIVFTAEDDYIEKGNNNEILDLRLADSEEFMIKVIGPPPIIIGTTSYSNAIEITWEAIICENVKYAIYRNTKYLNYKPGECDNGIPSSTGYELVEIVNGTTYLDNNLGKGLPQGYEYCYMIVAIFSNGANGLPSEEICTYLAPPVPNIIKTSVTVIDQSEGEISLAWVKPQGLDTLGFNGPFKYKIYRGNTLWGTSFDLIDSIEVADTEALKIDTTYIDYPINTVEYPYSYLIELYNVEPGKVTLIGNPGIASTLYADFEASDKKLKLLFMRNVPWINYQYEIFRQDEPVGDFYSIGYSTEEFYVDSGLVNNKQYCYRLRSEGNYIHENGNLYYTENLSHITCGIPTDTIPPNPPLLNVVQDCDSGVNYLSWINQSYETVVNYLLYFKTNYNQNYDSVITFNSNINSYTHKHYNTSAYCYYITATDSAGNESNPSNEQCVDLCLVYQLPNVFTPNGDGINDIYKPISIDKSIEKVDMKIFNRWGQLVFQTDKPEINWNGLHYETKKLVPPGVYYYVCDAYAKGIFDVKPYNFLGFIHVYMEKDAEIIEE